VGKDSATFVLSFLKKSPKKDVIEQEIKRVFEIDKIIEEDKDLIFICH